MIQSNSFSKIGQKLDKLREATMQTGNQQHLQKILKQKLRPYKSKSAAKKSKLFQTIPRQTLNSFQRCHTKQINTKAIYADKIQSIKSKTPFFSISKQNRPQLFSQKNEQQKKLNQKNCQKCKIHDQMLVKNSFLNQRLKRVQSTQTFKCFDIKNQGPRYYEVQLQKLQKEISQRNLRRTQNNLDNEEEAQIKLKVKNFQILMRKTHSFTSYTKRDFLNTQNPQGSQSGLQAFKVKMEKYKKGEVKSNSKFDKFVDKIRTRYDRDCEPWITKLNYYPKDTLLTQRKTNYYEFSKQSERKPNQVNSKYAIRIAL